MINNTTLAISSKTIPLVTHFSLVVLFMMVFPLSSSILLLSSEMGTSFRTVMVPKWVLPVGRRYLDVAFLIYRCFY